MYVVKSINKCGNRVLSYTLVKTGSTDEMDVDKNEIIELISNGEVGNAAVQKYKEQLIVRVKDGQTLTRSVDGSPIPVREAKTTVPKQKELVSKINAGSIVIKAIKVTEDNISEIEDIRKSKRELLNPDGYTTIKSLKDKYRYAITQTRRCYGIYAGDKPLDYTLLLADQGKLTFAHKGKITDMLGSMGYDVTYGKWYFEPTSTFNSERELAGFIAELIKGICKTYLVTTGQSNSFVWNNQIVNDCRPYIGWLHSTIGKCYSTYLTLYKKSKGGR